METFQGFVGNSIRLAGQLAVGPRQVGCGGAVHAQQILRNPVIVSCSNKIDSRLRRVSFQSYLFINFTLWLQNTTTHKNTTLYTTYFSDIRCILPYDSLCCGKWSEEELQIEVKPCSQVVFFRWNPLTFDTDHKMKFDTLLCFGLLSRPICQNFVSQLVSKWTINTAKVP